MVPYEIRARQAQVYCDDVASRVSRAMENEEEARLAEEKRVKKVREKQLEEEKRNEDARKQEEWEEKRREAAKKKNYFALSCLILFTLTTQTNSTM